MKKTFYEYSVILSVVTGMLIAMFTKDYSKASFFLLTALLCWKASEQIGKLPPGDENKPDMYDRFKY